MTEKYNDDSIKALKGAERVRKRPSAILGTGDIQGALHAVNEILGNAFDEGRAGYGDVVTFTLYKDGSVSVEDQGRGVPMGWNEKEGRYNWDLIFNELYAGGKYDDDGEDYKFSIGLNGLGAAATQYTSEYMTVISKRQDTITTKHFKRGVPVEEELLVEPNTTGKTGTFIRWKPDDTVFSNTKFTPSMFRKTLESQAYINEKTVVFVDEQQGTTETYQGDGIQAYLLSQIDQTMLLEVLEKETETQGVNEAKKKYRAKIDMVLAITEETQGKLLYFHNTGQMKVGVHTKAFDKALSDFFKNVAKQNDVTINANDYSGYVSTLISTYSNIVDYSNQTKDGVNDKFIYQLVYDTVLYTLEEGLSLQKPSILQLVNNVVIAAKARKKAKELEMLEKQMAKKGEKKDKMPVKLVACSNKSPMEKRELFIVEGDSALGACKDARDSYFQAILAVKGKPRNSLKVPLTTLLENKVVQDIITTVGTGIETAEMSNFDISRCNYDKIIITTDADIDGKQIRVLLFLLFLTIMPKLIDEGRLYVALTPLFEVVVGKKSYFAYSDEEKDQLLEKLKQEGKTPSKINRSKGLGQNDQEMLWETTMNPETRQLVPLQMDTKDPVVREVMATLLGAENVDERKAYILELISQSVADKKALAVLNNLEVLAAVIGPEEEDEG